MVIIHLTNCPIRLRGDITKWLAEINTGVYIGRVSARVRDELWERVCAYSGTGQATMIYSSNNEQGYSFRVHNTDWQPMDYDGITLMKRPIETHISHGSSGLKQGFSKASKYRMMQTGTKQKKEDQYIILDLETTGLDVKKDSILEIGALKIKEGDIVDSFSCLIRQTKKIPEHIVKLTGISEDIVKMEGIALKEALDRCMRFVGNNTVWGYNVSFDMEFIEEACKKEDVRFGISKTKDVFRMAKKKLDNVKNYKMETVAKYFSPNWEQVHRALEDSELTFRILMKLNEI